MSAIIVIDVGTTSIRGVLYDDGGRVLTMNQHPNSPQYLPDGRVEQDPATWLSCMNKILIHCAGHAHNGNIDIAGIALTSQRSSVIPVDDKGEAIYHAIMWQDKRADSLCRTMESQVPRVFARTGAKISPVFSAPKIRWLKDNEPEVYEQAGKFIGIQDFLIHHLTGNFVTDHTFASRTNLMNLRTRTWDPDLLELFRIDRRLLCDLIPPGSVAGTLTADAASACGLPAGLPVVSAGGDQNCAAVGLGVFSSGQVIANTGTGSYLIAHTDTPVIDEQMRISCNASAVPGAYILEAAVLTTGVVYRWFAEQFYPGTSTAEGAFDAINTDAAEAPAGSNGLILLPYFKGSGSPYWNPKAKGSFLNLSVSTTRQEMARSILEGIAAELQDNLRIIESFSAPVQSVEVSGGLTGFDLFNQIQADILGRPVVLYHFREATAQGAWMTAATTLGMQASLAEAYASLTDGNPPTEYTPDTERRKTYSSMMLRRKKICSLLERHDFYALLDTE